jgi:hypothetical protein
MNIYCKTKIFCKQCRLNEKWRDAADLPDVCPYGYENKIVEQLYKCKKCTNFNCEMKRTSECKRQDKFDKGFICSCVEDVP